MYPNTDDVENRGKFHGNQPRPGVRFDGTQKELVPDLGRVDSIEPKVQRASATAATAWHLATSQSEALAKLPTAVRCVELPPQGLNAVCGDCCWRGLTVMLLQELQVLKRAIGETRDAFAVEQARALASFDSAPDQDAYVTLIREHSRLKEQLDNLTVERPALLETRLELEAVVNSQRQELKVAEAECSHLECELRMEEEQSVAGALRLQAAEDSQSGLAAALSELRHDLQATSSHASQQKALLDILTTDRDFFQAKLHSLRPLVSATGKSLSKAKRKGRRAR